MQIKGWLVRLNLVMRDFSNKGNFYLSQKCTKILVFVTAWVLASSKCTEISFRSEIWPTPRWGLRRSPDILIVGREPLPLSSPTRLGVSAPEARVPYRRRSQWLTNFRPWRRGGACSTNFFGDYIRITRWWKMPKFWQWSFQCSL